VYSNSDLYLGHLPLRACARRNRGWGEVRGEGRKGRELEMRWGGRWWWWCDDDDDDDDDDDYDDDNDDADDNDNAADDIDDGKKN